MTMFPRSDLLVYAANTVAGDGWGPRISAGAAASSGWAVPLSARVGRGQLEHLEHAGRPITHAAREHFPRRIGRGIIRVLVLIRVIPHEFASVRLPLLPMRGCRRMPELVFSLFGSPRLEREGGPISVDTRKAIALLAYLAVTRQPYRRDALATLLWPEYDQPHARATLRRTLSALSKALDGASLSVERETIGLRGDADLHLDVDEFHRYLAECQSHGHSANDVCAACLAPLSAAAALYRDDFMAGFSLRDSPAFDDWQFYQREALRRELAGALHRLTRGYIAFGSLDMAIESARRWLALDELHEPAHRYLMRLYAWTGQRAAALRQYRECVQALDRELGVAPLEQTTRLYEAIKDNHLAPPPAADRPTSTAGASRHAAPPLDAMTPATAMPTGTGTGGAPLAPAGVYPFVGRTREWNALVGAYDGIRSKGQVVIVEGEAGIGKTRLAEEFAAYAQKQHAAVIAARCYDGEATLAYAPLAAALRSALASEESARRIGELPDRWIGEASRLVPELERVHPGLPPVPPLNSPGAQSQFFEGIRQVLLAACRGATPGILLFDDVQWADSASLDVLRYLARRLHEHPVCLLLTWRSSEAPGSPQIRQLLAEAQRAGNATVITLPRLSEGAVSELLRLAPSGPVPPETAQRLYEETEGVPFFLVEYLLALSNGVVAAEQQSWSLPGGIRELLRSRLRAVGDTSGQVLTAAAVIGRWFDFETVREVSGRSEDETIAALEDLVAHGLIHELRGTGTGTAGSVPVFDFSHEKLRSLVYDETSLARRRLLHRRAAEALTGALRRRREGGGLLGQIAHHYLMSGDQAMAAEYYKQAGERARSLYANAEAIAHVRTALALGHPDTAALHEVLGGLHTILGEYTAALQSYEAAIAAASPEAVARLEHELGNVYARRGEWEQARHHFERSLEHLGMSGQAGERAGIYADWSLVAHRQGKLDEAWQLALQARELAANTEDGRALAQAHNMLGVLASSRGNVDDAVDHLERSLALAESADDTSVRAAALNNLALALAARGDPEQAIAHAEAALALCAAQGDRHHEAALHNNIADLLHAAGRPEAAMAHLKEAVRIYSEIGVEAGAVQPDIWKLTEW